MAIDKLDRKIISILLENSRLSYREIAKLADTSAVTALNRISRLEKDGIIRSYSAKIDPEKLGFDFQIMAMIRPKQGDYSLDYPGLTALYKTTGDYQYMAVARFRTREEMERFIEFLAADKSVESFRTEFIIRSGEVDLRI